MYRKTLKILFVFDSVYRPAEDSFLLSNFVSKHVKVNGKIGVDIGCGTGITTISLLSSAKRIVIATDINYVAALNTLVNSKILGFDAILEVICCSSLNALRHDLKVDLVISNPPYLPTVQLEDLSYSGGKKGVETLLKMFADSFKRKCDKCIFILSSRSNIKHLAKYIKKAGYCMKILEKMAFFFEEIYLLEISKVAETSVS